MRIVAGKFRGKQLNSPSDDSIRPTSDRVRESVFNILGSRLGPVLTEKRVLDLFAGTGALGFEALSRGASHVTFVDTGAESRGLIRDHIQAFGAAGITKLLRRDATALGKPGTFGQFDLIFLDPPYAQEMGEKALAGCHHRLGRILGCGSHHPRWIHARRHPRIWRCSHPLPELWHTGLIRRP
jgi:16S rRNA (guanine966-N2)-methyltransferase